MKHKFVFVISSLLLVFTFLVGSPVTQAITSESDYNIENQQKRKYVEIERFYGENDTPPKVYFYTSSDGYKGYLGLKKTYFDETFRLYVAVYAGYIFDRPPYPLPLGTFLEE